MVERTNPTRESALASSLSIKSYEPLSPHLRKAGPDQKPPLSPGQLDYFWPTYHVVADAVGIGSMLLPPPYSLVGPGAKVVEAAVSHYVDHDDWSAKKHLQEAGVLTAATVVLAPWGRLAIAGKVMGGWLGEGLALLSKALPFVDREQKLHRTAVALKQAATTARAGGNATVEAVGANAAQVSSSRVVNIDGTPHVPPPVAPTPSSSSGGMLKAVITKVQETVKNNLPKSVPEGTALLVRQGLPRAGGAYLGGGAGRRLVEDTFPPSNLESWKIEQAEHPLVIDAQRKMLYQAGLSYSIEDIARAKPSSRNRFAQRDADIAARKEQERAERYPKKVLPIEIDRVSNGLNEEVKWTVEEAERAADQATKDAMLDVDRLLKKPSSERASTSVKESLKGASVHATEELVVGGELLPSNPSGRNQDLLDPLQGEKY